MSWSIDGSIRRPIEVSALLHHTREVLRELPAIDEVPDLLSKAPMVPIETAGTDITFGSWTGASDTCASSGTSRAG